LFKSIVLKRNIINPIDNFLFQKELNTGSVIVNFVCLKHEIKEVRMPRKTISEGINKEIGEKLRRVRQHQLLSQQNVADDIGVSASAYSKMENGKTDFSATRLSQLATYFKVHLPDFLDPRVNIPRNINEIGQIVDYDKALVERDVARAMLRDLFNKDE